MRIRFKLWVESDSGELLVGDGRLQILLAIARTGSLSAAARDLNMSYRALWGRVRATEKRLGWRLVEGAASGTRREGVHLTERARELVSRFQALQQRAETEIQRLATTTLGGELGSG